MAQWKLSADLNVNMKTFRDRPLFFYWRCSHFFLNKLTACKKVNEKIVSRKNSLKQIVCTILVKLESLFFCTLLDAIIVWYGLCT